MKDQIIARMPIGNKYLEIRYDGPGFWPVIALYNSDGKGLWVEVFTNSDRNSNELPALNDLITVLEYVRLRYQEDAWEPVPESPTE